MYFRKIGNHRRITKEIGNLLIRGQIVGQLIKGILNASIVKKKGRFKSECRSKLKGQTRDRTDYRNIQFLNTD